MFDAPGRLQRGLNVLVDDEMRLRIRVKQPDPLIKLCIEPHPLEQAKHVVPVDAIKSLLKIKKQRIRLFLLTRYKVLHVSEKADVVVDRPTFDEAFLVQMGQVDNKMQ